MGKIRRVQIVKKQPADATLLVAMFEEEIVIAPLFVTWIDIVAKRLTQIARGAMPVNGVFFKAVVGR